MRYQQRMARLVERKIQQTREKLAVLGARDEDDYGLVLPPEGFVPELPVRDENGSFAGAYAWGKNFRYLMEKVCRQHNRKIYYRTWGFGAFQYDPECYLQISGQIEPHEKFFFSMLRVERVASTPFDFIVATLAYLAMMPPTPWVSITPIRS